MNGLDLTTVTRKQFESSKTQTKFVNNSTFSQHGLIPTDGVNEIRPKDMFEEVDVANVLRLSDKAKSYKVRFTDGIYDMNGDDFALPKAPFATGSTDELLDDKVNGITTKIAHKKGDIVVCGNELVTNGGFDNLDDTTNTDDTNNALTNMLCRDGGKDGSLWRITNGSLISEEYTTHNGNVRITTPNIAGLEYIVSFKAAIIGSPSTYPTFETISPYDGFKHTLSSSKTYTFTFITDENGSDIRITNQGECTLSIDNISVKLKNNSYIALQDTTAGDLLTDTSKFKPIPYVTKQVALCIKKDANGKVTNEALPLVNMYGEENVLTYEEDIFGELGFSQLKDRVYTDGNSEYILLGLKIYNNDGAYSPIFNPHGSRKFSDDKLWYETNDTVGGTYDCF